MKKLAVFILCLMATIGVVHAQTMDKEYILNELGRAFNEAITTSNDEDFRSCEYKDGKLIFTCMPGSVITSTVLALDSQEERQQTVNDMFITMFEEDGKEFFDIIEFTETPLVLVIPNGKNDPLTFTVAASDMRRHMK